jgi:hypothetical protein
MRRSGNETQVDNQRKTYGNRPQFNTFRKPFNGNSNTISNTNTNSGTNNNDVSTNLKQQLINYVYSNVELFKFNYKLLQFESDLPLLIKEKKKVAGTFSGPNCLLVFTKIRDRFHTVLIDKKTLSYNQDQLNLDTVKITPVNIRLDPSIYNGSILDGVLRQTNNSRTFIITDVYLFRGQNLINDKIQYKMMNITSYLQANLNNGGNMNNLELSVNKLYELSDIDKLKEDIKKTNQNSAVIKGYTFYPEYSGTKLIFLCNNDKRDEQQTSQSQSQSQSQSINLNNASKHSPKHSTLKNNESSQQKQKKSTIKYVPKTGETIVATFEVRKTPIIDVYKLYLVERDSKNGKTILKSKKMGLAHIPTRECSKLCKDIISNNKKERILMKCKFINDRNKWEPFEEDKEKKYPSCVSDLENKMDLLEESESSDDE